MMVTEVRLERLTGRPLQTLLDFLEDHRGSYLSEISRRFSDTIFEVLTRRNLGKYYPLETDRRWSLASFNIESEEMLALCTAKDSP